MSKDVDRLPGPGFDSQRAGWGSLTHSTMASLEDIVRKKMQKIIGEVSRGTDAAKAWLRENQGDKGVGSACFASAAARPSHCLGALTIFLQMFRQASAWGGLPGGQQHQDRVRPDCDQVPQHPLRRGLRRQRGSGCSRGHSKNQCSPPHDHPPGGPAGAGRPGGSQVGAHDCRYLLPRLPGLQRMVVIIRVILRCRVERPARYLIQPGAFAALRLPRPLTTDSLLHSARAW